MKIFIVPLPGFPGWRLEIFPPSLQSGVVKTRKCWWWLMVNSFMNHFISKIWMEGLWVLSMSKLLKGLICIPVVFRQNMERVWAVSSIWNLPLKTWENPRPASVLVLWTPVWCLQVILIKIRVPGYSRPEEAIWISFWIWWGRRINPLRLILIFLAKWSIILLLNIPWLPVCFIPGTSWSTSRMIVIQTTRSMEIRMGGLR